MALLGDLDQLFAEFRVRDLRKLHHPLVDTLALEFGDAVFGDHEVDIAARGGDPGPFAEVGDDAGNLSTLGGGGHRHDGKAAFRHGAAAQEIHLVADPAVKHVPHGIGAHLPGEIDLEGRTDRDQVVVARDHQGVVDEIRCPEVEGGVVVHEVVEPLGPHAQGGDDLTGRAAGFFSCW